MVKANSGNKISNVLFAGTLAIAANGMVMGSGLAADINIIVPFSIEGMPAGTIAVDVVCQVAGGGVPKIGSLVGYADATGFSVAKSYRYSIDIDPVTGDATTPSPIIIKDTNIGNATNSDVQFVRCALYKYQKNIGSKNNYAQLSGSERKQYYAWVPATVVKFTVAK